MNPVDKINEKLKDMISNLLSKQKDNGVWNFCFEGSIMTDAYMIILIRILELTDEEVLVKSLVERIKSQQESNGAWKVYPDEDGGNLSVTIEGYFSLLYSGYVAKNAGYMRKAERFIQENGGLSKSDWLTKMMLAITGQIKWPSIIKIIPIEIMLLPSRSPISIYQFVGYARAHWIPILICSNLNYSYVHSRTPNLTHLQGGGSDDEDQRLLEDMQNLQLYFKNALKKLAGSTENLKRKAFIKAEDYILERIEENGTLYSYFSASFFMVFALLALGYDKKNPLIGNAFQGMKAYLCRSADQVFIQNSPSTVWDTALLSAALQQAGVPHQHASIMKASNYLLSRQQQKYGDWAIKNPDVTPGGWGFSDTNTFVPDIDDTTAALRAITPLAGTENHFKHAWNKGVEWVLTMQNDDGGWSAFEKNTDNYLLSFIPSKYEDRVLFDPSTADLTGRTLYFLGEYTTMPQESDVFQKAREWFEHNQEENGSWYGRWGNCYIYGTWAAITGLKAIGVSSDNPLISRGVKWLLSIQNEDGGWGESCESDSKKRYVPLHHSTPSQTAWALDALISASEIPTPKIEKGMHSLLSLLEASDWRSIYPTGAGIPGGYYIHYHSYKYIWPLHALSHYKNKYYEIE
ncbi:squalene--hopene cyclase [Sutcliffiella horikoshii]|uniref:Squalene--hopene cyclase n=1 Tax=Sutcliffiella horikoshii TaxID=79883 RepID=A0A5D4SXS0_9BACI|nr:squalene--hopene cyclase [Sutcliffiella horikoshii]TYS67461.1 squalene--hopene cyclase [Sutcliffiella horikoshii]